MPAIHAPSLARGRCRARAAAALRGAHSTSLRAMCGSTVQAMTKTWLITGAGRGMGVEFARAALAAGHNVVATGRNPDTVRSAVGVHENLLVTTLDVTDVHKAEGAVSAAVERFGRIDVLLNNAGSFLTGFFEELTTEQVRSQIETNLFGPMTLTRAVLPVMRRRHSGMVISISSGAGVIGSPSGSAYAASKFALEGWMESLAGEIEPFGIRSMIVEPGFFRTELLTPESTTFGELSIDDYDQARAEINAFWASMNGTQAGDPAKLARALVQLADSSEPPLRWAAGKDVVGGVEQKARLLLAQVDAHRELSTSLAHEDAKVPA
nr:SDR family oxidoreductase [Candidatus Solirubrobacter pratensis]